MEGAVVMGEHPSMDELPLPSEEELKAIHQKQLERAQAMERAAAEAAEKLQALMQQDSDLSRLAYMILFGYRLIHWAAGEAERVKGMSPIMQQILLESEQLKAREVFDFAEMIKDFQSKQMPWLEGQRREALARRRSRERRIKYLKDQLRRDDIPLPFHSMRRLFGEEGFTHDNILLVYGPREALGLVLRRCALDYQKAGGTVALLSGAENDGGDERIAKLMIPSSAWRDMCYVYDDLLTVLTPVTLMSKRDPIGLLVVEGLDNACPRSPVQASRPQRLLLSLSYLQNYHREHGMAVIVGIATDDDQVGVDMRQLYPPQMLNNPHVIVATKESELVAGSVNIVICNDVVPMDSLREGLEDKSK